MNHFTIRNSLALALITSTMGFAQDSVSASRIKAIASSVTADTVDVQHVINAYHDAVLNHDGSRLASLFIPEGSMWLNVLSDDTYARAKAKSPDAQKIRVGSYTDFAKRWFPPPKPASIQRTRIFRKTATARLPLCILTSSSW